MLDYPFHREAAIPRRVLDLGTDLGHGATRKNPWYVSWRHVPIRRSWWCVGAVPFACP